MLTQYMVLLETTKSLMVLRPYQIYAVQKIVEHVQNSDQNGYIWHTTGSGKTLTSFKASQIIMQMPDVERSCLWSIVTTSTRKPHANLMLLKPTAWTAPITHRPW